MKKRKKIKRQIRKKVHRTRINKTVLRQLLFEDFIELYTRKKIKHQIRKKVHRTRIRKKVHRTRINKTVLRQLLFEDFIELYTRGEKYRHNKRKRAALAGWKTRRRNKDLQAASERAIQQDLEMIEQGKKVPNEIKTKETRDDGTTADFKEVISLQKLEEEVRKNELHLNIKIVMPKDDENGNFTTENEVHEWVIDEITSPLVATQINHLITLKFENRNSNDEWRYWYVMPFWDWYHILDEENNLIGYEIRFNYEAYREVADDATYSDFQNTFNSLAEKAKSPRNE